MNNNLPISFNAKLNNALVQYNADNILSGVEKQLLANTYINVFNSFYGVNNFQAQTYYIYDPRFRSYINQYVYANFYNQMIKELNLKVNEINQKIYNVILNINRYLYS